MSRQHVLIGLLIMLMLSPGAPITAQDGGDSCPAIVQTALETVGEACAGLGHNQACYGHNRVDATFWEPRDDLVFSAPADRVPLADLQTIATAPLDVDAAQWGVAALHVQANVPETLPGQAVTFLLMGDAVLENAVPPETLIPEVTAQGVTTADVILRSGPTSTANTIGTLPEETPVTLIGIDETEHWYEVLAGEGSSAWVERSLVTVDDLEALETLPVTFGKGIPPRYGPMQAFYFTTGLGGMTCREAPDALFVESPEGIEVALNINNMDVQMGSAAMFTTVPAGPEGERAMVAALLEGHLRATVNGVETVLDTPGAALAVTLNAEGLVDETSMPLDPLPLLEAAQLDPLGGQTCHDLSQIPLLERTFDPAACDAGLHPPPLPPGSPLSPPPGGPDAGLPPDEPPAPPSDGPPGPPPEEGGCFWPAITTMQIPGDVSQTIEFTAVPGAAYYTWHIEGSGYQASGTTAGTSFFLDISPLTPGVDYQMWVEPNAADGSLLCGPEHAPPPVSFHRIDPDNPPPPGS